MSPAEHCGSTFETEQPTLDLENYSGDIPGDWDRVYQSSEVLTSAPDSGFHDEKKEDAGVDEDEEGDVDWIKIEPHLDRPLREVSDAMAAHWLCNTRGETPHAGSPSTDRSTDDTIQQDSPEDESIEKPLAYSETNNTQIPDTDRYRLDQDPKVVWETFVARGFGDFDVSYANARIPSCGHDSP